MHINTAMAKWGTKVDKIEETTLLKDSSSAVLNFEKEGGGGRKKSFYNTRYSYLVTHASTTSAGQG